MKAESEGLFPTLEKAREMLQTDSFKKGVIPEVLHCLHYRGRLPNNENEEEEEDEVTEQVFYNNPMRTDLNKKDTVINIFTYLWCIIFDMLKQPSAANDTEIPITQDIPAAGARDGSPTSSAQNWLRD